MNGYLGDHPFVQVTFSPIISCSFVMRLHQIHQTRSPWHRQFYLATLLKNLRCGGGLGEGGESFDSFRNDQEKGGECIYFCFEYILKLANKIDIAVFFCRLGNSLCERVGRLLITVSCMHSLLRPFAEYRAK